MECKRFAQEKYHKLLLDTHLDFIKTGAEVIVTNTFTTRKKRLRDNKVEGNLNILIKKQVKLLSKQKN